jgi:glycosyltransferase involved in cell wall biosynthesis
MNSVSVLVITKNESYNITECLESVRWADEIVIVDAESKDDTVARAKKFTDKITVRPWTGFAAAKQFALEQCSNDWILWLDADERVLPELAEEIQTLMKRDPQESAFTVARRAYFLGRWMRHSGWYPGRVARLFNKHKARFNSAAVHEGLTIDGTVGALRHDLLHYTDPNIYHYFAKYNRYTSLAADEAAARGKRSRISDVLIRPAWQFFRMYVLRLGMLDGIQGLLLALFSSSYVFTKYAKLREKEFSIIQRDAL